MARLNKSGAAAGGGDKGKSKGSGTQVPSTPPAEHGALGLKDNDEVREALRVISQKMDVEEAKRAAANEALSGLRQEVKARGIDRAAFDAARKQVKSMKPEKREQFDTDLAICRKAFGIPIQPALFDEDARDDGAKATH